MEVKPIPASDNARSSRSVMHDLLLQAYIETGSKIHSRWNMLVGLIAVFAGLWMVQLIWTTWS